MPKKLNKTAASKPQKPIKSADIDVNLLLFFSAVASELSFTRAATKLGVDQSWLSQKVRQFEAQLGCSLFERSTRRVALTRAGRILAEPTEKLEAATREARRIASLLSREMESAIRIGALPHSFFYRERVDLIDGLIASHPEVSVEIINGASMSMIQALRDGRLDVAFSCWPFDPKGLEMLLLRIDRYGILVPEDDELARKAEIRLEDLRGKKIVTAPEKHNPFTYRSLYGPLFEAGAIDVQVPEFEHSALIRVASARRMFSLYNLESTRNSAEVGLVRRQITGRGFTNKKCLVRVKDRYTPAVLALWDLAIESGATEFTPEPEHEILMLAD